MYRPDRIFDSHIHLSTAGTSRLRQQAMAQLDEALVKAYHKRWRESLASRQEQGPEREAPEAEAAAARWKSELEAAGIERAVFFTSVEAPDELARFVSADPARFVGYATLDPTEAGSAGRLEAQVAEHGIKGLKLYPMARHFHVDAAECHPVYEVCEAAGLPVIIHFGLSINATHDLTFGNPLALSGLALRFPRLKWIVPHFGTGFFRELLLLAAQYPNVYVDTSSSNNWVRYSPYPLTVKDLFQRTYETVGSKRILFGTDSSFFPRGYRRNILEEQLRICSELGLSRDEMDDIFFRNIEQILSL